MFTHNGCRPAASVDVNYADIIVTSSNDSTDTHNGCCPAASADVKYADIIVTFSNDSTNSLAASICSDSQFCVANIDVVNHSLAASVYDSGNNCSTGSSLQRSSSSVVEPEMELGDSSSPYVETAIFGDAFEYIDKLINNEIQSEKFVLAEEKPHCVHALGAVPKSNGSYRPITDCRRPLFMFINNFMDTTFESFSYSSTDQVCDLITDGCYMATVDIASAYRTVSIRPDQWTYQGVAWPIEGALKYLYDVRLSFGLRCAPFIFTQLSDFVVRTMERLGYPNVISYLDDFIIVESSRDNCVSAQSVLFELLGSIGFQAAWDKCTAPSTKVRYLGIDFDSVQMTLSLPKDKLAKLYNELEFFKDKIKATKRQLQRLCGVLSHAAKVIRGGRVFSRRIIDLLKELPPGNPRVRLTEDFRLDMEWWRQYSADFNGKAKLIHNNFGQGPVLYSDACLQGYGFVCGEHWQAGAFNAETVPVDLGSVIDDHAHWINVPIQEDVSINYLELVAIFLALCKFACAWRDQHVLCYTDNTQAMAALNRGTSASKSSMCVIRQIFWICAKYNIYLSALHVAGELNLLADWLSRACIRGSLDIEHLPICCRVVGAVGQGSVSSSQQCMGI